MAAANYRFLPWSRRGFAAEAQADDTGQPLPPRVLSEAALTLSGGLSAGVNIAAFGPGDVTGFDSSAIIGTTPKPGVTDAEPENLVTIEFDLPELPWLLTPAQPRKDRLRPWFMLVVLDASGSDAVAEPMSLPTRCFPSVDLTSEQVSRQLPDLADSWCWGHCQLIADAPGGSAEALAEAPLLNLSRIVSPRRLEPMKSYRACLVPCFDLGVERGLGRTPDPGAVLKPAWDVLNAAPLTLPIYHHWIFSTGPAGDFETLARALKPLHCPEAIGLVELDVSEAFPAFGSEPLPMQGVLQSGKAPPPSLSEVDAAIQNQLVQATNPANGMSMPVYGSAYAQTSALTSEAPVWLSEVNLDPRMRIAAGLGAQMVRTHQEAFVQACWEQVGAIIEANQLMDRGRLSVETLGRVARRITALPPALSLLKAGPLLDRIAFKGGTVGAAIVRSTLADNLFSAPFRRLASPGRSASRRAAKHLGGRRDAGVGRILSLGLDPAKRGGFLIEAPAESRNKPDAALPANPRLAAAVNTVRAHARLGARDPLVKPVAFELDRAREALEKAIEPRRNVAARVRAMLAVDGAPPDAAMTIAPITIAPALPEPAFLRLAEADRSVFLSGADALPENSFTLLTANQRFIEAFMVGLNHEMNRELQWRGFPVDMRGTPFQHFWDWGDGAADIAPIADWPASARLGDNPGAGGVADSLVLLVRSPILNRFPGSIIAAWKAEARGGGMVLKPNPVQGDRASGSDYLRPAFMGSLSADTAFAGFALTRADIETGAGWFFVIEQQWTEPRFGFEGSRPGETPSRPANWLDAKWGDTGVVPGGHIGTAGPLAGHTAQGVTFSANAGHFAAAALKRPFRVAIHGRHLLATDEVSS